MILAQHHRRVTSWPNFSTTGACSPGRWFFKILDGKAVRWSIHRQDNEPFTVAAIWDSWTDRITGEIVDSFSMLTINADGHPVMGRFHRPGDQRRSLVVVPPHAWHNWLNATTGTACDLLTEMPTAEFGAGPVGGKGADANSQAALL